MGSNAQRQASESMVYLVDGSLTLGCRGQVGQPWAVDEAGEMGRGWAEQDLGRHSKRLGFCELQEAQEFKGIK